MYFKIFTIYKKYILSPVTYKYTHTTLLLMCECYSSDIVSEQTSSDNRDSEVLYLLYMNSDLQLYNYFRSSASYRVRLGLHAKKLNFEYISVHLIKNNGEQYSDQYKLLNSLSQVPTLIHKTSNEPKVLSQSVAILEYLEEVFPEVPLLPTESFQRAKIREFVETINSLAQPMGNLGTLQYLEKNHQFDQQMKTAWIHYWSAKAFQHLEGLCQKFHGTFCFQDQFTLAECFLLPQLFTARRFKVDLSPYQTLLKIEKNCAGFEFVQKAHPENQIDFES